ncbi:MAG: hypothetical protein WA192_01840 [Candidatus Acidiferrales bacterium]
MSDDWIEEDALRFEGFNDVEIAQIKAAIPQILALLALYQKNLPDINKAKTLFDSLTPVGVMALTKLQARIS